MLKRIKNRKAQNTAEYAILIALVIGAVIAMQTYLQRGISGRVMDTTKWMANATQSGGVSYTGTGYQYSPYYESSNYKSNRVEADNTVQYGATNSRYVTEIANTSRSGDENATFSRTGITDY